MKTLTESQIDELIEKYIIVSFDEETEDRIRMTKRTNFLKQDYCKCYGNYGNQVGCYDAGCYTLDNSGSSAQSDCSSAIADKFGACVSLEECAGKWTVQETDEDQEFTETQIAEIEKFIAEWRKENETHTEVTAWTYHDSHNFKTVVLHADFGEPDCNELEEAEQRAILAEYPGIPHIEGTNASEETENFIFSFDLWATNPWVCYIEKNNPA